MLSLSFHFPLSYVWRFAQDSGVIGGMQCAGYAGGRQGDLLRSYHDGDGAEVHGNDEYSSRMTTQLVQFARW